MKVKGKVGDHECIFLVDSGSTHNFLSNKVADRMGIDSNEEEQFEVVIANGERISSAGLCKSVRDQWLRTLGPIIWDFSKLFMQFKIDGKEVKLKGLAPLVDKIVDEQEIQKALNKERQSNSKNIFSFDSSPTR
ncbi:hypothetical protein CICLE_v10024262mg [Citrus x clementina]|uniref:Aspartic peptidase DDI1-type domain-containing protein n=1 Tax=Citrus clementina TaxID=85681 RepID=V4TYK5_CITCL|nr:hypothetical protein CICLE_v10024262mg [Citrus x clementina]